ncbi:MAG TPA: glucosamine-6-phosphate deaminase [Devosiaceae bacterium]|jgi:glucosamine-6-phosphate deaminase
MAPAEYHRRFDALEVIVSPTRPQMGARAATDIAAELRTRLANQPGVRMIFAAAPSQSEMLAALIEAPGIDWQRVTAFHMDEYVGLPPGAPERFAEWLDACLFSRLPFAAVHKLQPDSGAEAEATRYAALLSAAPIDIVCLGIGVNAHIAFNDPPVADFNDPLDVKVVELDAVCRQQQVDDKCFPSLDDVPHYALSLTIPRLLRADKLFCIVPGPAKRDAVTGTLYGPIVTACPSSILRQQANCTLYIDANSAPAQFSA